MQLDRLVHVVRTSSQTCWVDRLVLKILHSEQYLRDGLLCTTIWYTGSEILLILWEVI